MIISISIVIVVIILSLFLIPANNIKVIHNISLVGGITIFLLSLFILINPMTIATYFEQGFMVIISFPSIIFTYAYMLDNIAIIFIVLATLLGFIVTMLTRKISYRLKEKYILLLVIEFLLIQCFTAIEIIFFYLCFETLLIPVYTLIGIWGS